MAIGNLQAGAFRQLAATANIKSSQGALLGFFVSSSTAGTIAIYDDTATGTTTKILDTFTPAGLGWFDLPAAFATGCYVVIGGTMQVTLVYV